MVHYKRFLLIFSTIFPWVELISYEKTWVPNNDIFDEKNQNTKEKNCKQVKFDLYNSAPIILQNITTNEFILPIEGEFILLDGSFLEISSEKSTCLDVKPMEFHEFLKPQNWFSEGFTNNLAVPDAEKIPCYYDKIKLPRGIFSAISTNLLPNWYTVSYLQFEDVLLDDIELQSFKKTDLGSAVFNRKALDALSIQKMACDATGGCTCTNERIDVVCGVPRDVQCKNGVNPYGFCDNICGAFIILTPKSDFALHKIEDDLKKYADIETHVSKVWTSENAAKIQIVFTEKEYKGKSIVYAKEYHEKLKQTFRLYKIEKIEDFKFSGAQINDNNPFTIMLISMLFVAAIFATIYILYGSDSRFNIGLRMTAPSMPLSSTYRARFSTGGDSGHFIKNHQSFGGSIVDLNASFENPMFADIDTSSNISLKPKEDVETVKEVQESSYSLLELAGKINEKFEAEKENGQQQGMLVDIMEE